MTLDFTVSRTLGGRFRIVITPPGGKPVDVTFFRGVPTQITDYSSADPFSDALANLTFPQLTAYDTPDSPDTAWYADDANVDIWWVPGQADLNAARVASPGAAIWVNPLTSAPTAAAPGTATSNGVTTALGTKVWEGFVTQWGVSSSDSADSVTAECQGALFQVDGYDAKPFYPPRPQTLESLILLQFDRKSRPNLRTAKAVVDWPEGWSLVAPAYQGANASTFSPNVTPGAKWTGYTTRQTGSWDKALTSFIANQLAVMLVKRGSGATPGAQWTLRMRHEGEKPGCPGRQPYLTVRDTATIEDFSVWAGAPGVQLDLTRDNSQKVDAIYGTGTDVGGTTWRNAEVNARGNRTDYAPIAALPAAWPADPQTNRHFDPTRIIREQYTSFGTGFSQADATDAAEQMLQRDRDAGWSGTITLSTDPTADMSRWEIRAGMAVRLLGFRGTGSDGMKFHIAQAEANPTQGTVALTVDNRYRDLLTLEQARARTLDPMTPAKLLQLNRSSVTIPDIQAPWDYSAGSGFVPRPSRLFHQNRDPADTFPYQSSTRKMPPWKHPAFYAHCDAGNPDSKKRWTRPKPVQVLMSEKGTIRRSEFAAYDRDGNVMAIPFHVSLYYANAIDYSNMPHLNGVYSPFIPGAFEPYDPSTGQPWVQAGHTAPDHWVMGWGNLEQPAGYSPGLKSRGNPVTGLLIDEGTWDWDCSANNPDYLQLLQPKPGDRERASVISLYAMFYADTTSLAPTDPAYQQNVYFMGRLIRQEPGTDS